MSTIKAWQKEVLTLQAQCQIYADEARNDKARIAEVERELAVRVQEGRVAFKKGFAYAIGTGTKDARIFLLEALLRELRREHKDCCCSKCEDITARIDAALRSTKTEDDARPLVLHENQRYLIRDGWVEGRDYVMSERLPQSMED